MRGVNAKGGSTREVSERAISTVLDVALCLLLVTASALTLAGVPSPREPEVAPASADETADLLATSTARVTYPVGDRTPTAHDTLAGLLADAVRADAGLSSTDEPAPNSTATATFVEAVVDRVERALRRVDHHAQVVARRSPASERPTDDGIIAGETPPSTADVHAAELAVREVEFTVRTWSA